MEKVTNPADGRSRLLQLTPATRDWILEVADVFTTSTSHIGAVLAREGIDRDELLDHLTRVQQVLELALDDLDQGNRR